MCQFFKIVNRDTQRLSSVKYLFGEANIALDCKTVRVFAYSSTREQSNKRSGARLKTVSEIPFFTDSVRKKTDCFAV